MTNIAIVGLGVIGGSYAKALKKHSLPNEKILGIDLNQNTIDRALEEGFIDEGETSNQTILQRADVVIFGLYPVAMKKFLVKYREDFKSGAIVTDTAGVKNLLVEDRDQYFPPQVDFILGHPMAGRENRGWDYASAEVFEGANYIITPTPENKPENIEWFKNFVDRIGFKRLTVTTPANHDAMIAYTSQLTHVIAVALVNSGENNGEIIRFVGDSFRDLTRIAKINEDLWSELFMENKAALLEVIESFESEIEILKRAIVTDNSETLKTAFRESTKRRLDLEASDYKLLK